MSLIQASRDGNLQEVILFIEKNGNKSIDNANIFGETALLESIFYGHENIAEYLLENGANATFGRPDGNRPLHLASNKGRYKTANLLLTKYAKRVKPTINAKNSVGNTALHEACIKTQVDIIQLLVENNIDIKSVNRRGQRAIDYTRDMRVFRLLRGKQWYEQLSDENIRQRLQNGISFNGRMSQINKCEKNEKRKSNKQKKIHKKKNMNENDSICTKNENVILMDDNNEHKQIMIDAEIEVDIKSKNGKRGKRRRKRRKRRIRNKNKNRKSVMNEKSGECKGLKEIKLELENWINFTEFVNIETQQRYQCLFLDARLRLKWLHFMQFLKNNPKNNNNQNCLLSLMAYNQKMIEYAEMLYIEYSQPMKCLSSCSVREENF